MKDMYKLFVNQCTTHLLYIIFTIRNYLSLSFLFQGFLFFLFFLSSEKLLDIIGKSFRLFSLFLWWCIFRLIAWNGLLRKISHQVLFNTKQKVFNLTYFCHKLYIHFNSITNKIVDKID